MKRQWQRILLGFIFTLGLFLRLWQLPSIPVGLHGDEASIGYNAYSLLKTGNDQNGVPWPLAIDQFGDFRPAGYHYLDIPFVKHFGLNALAVRLPSALFGALTILVLYFFMDELFKRKSLAMVTAFYLAISPWHINISRATSEGVVSGFFVLLGMWLLAKALNTPQKYSIPFILISFFSLCTSFLFYHAARLFVPVFLLPYILLLYTTRRPSKKIMGITISLVVILVIFLGGIFTLSQGASRPTNVGIFQIPGGDQEIFQQIGEDGERPAIVTRILHNKLLFYGKLFLTSYFWHFNGEFLFTSTGMPIRYKIPWTGNLYLADLLPLLFGAAILLVDGLRAKKLHLLLPLIWLLVGALPAGLTWEDLPNAQRASLMIPALIMISTYGLFELLALSRVKFIKTLIFLIYIAILIYGFFIFFHNYFYHLPRHEPWHRSAATPELITTIENIREKYREITVTTESNNNFIFYLFYRAYDPALYQRAGSPRESDGLVFEGIRYTRRSCPLGGNSEDPDEDKSNIDILFVNKASCKTPVNATILATIRTTDGLPAFMLLKIDPNWKPPPK